MRIIAGTLKGRTWSLPKGLDLRPTTDRAKESLFNVLQAHVDWPVAQCLDLFSGTGSIGFEMLSRGAARVDFLDKNPKSVQHIKRQLEQWNIKNASVIQANAFEFAQGRTAAYDFIFMDPPFSLNDALALPQMCIANGLLKPDGLLVLEHGPDWAKQTPEIPGWMYTKKYGHVHFSYFCEEEQV
ncbi:MAG: 16S rRNA (guanine(966)-N(2))-methyltransferase RsmD [Bacteroidetes bacterium]|nr:16S rRNA (guanine(966)-N(2))-methyltransferase RsmD [Bacteroidota bacterium]